jgi:hypothetical protein
MLEHFFGRKLVQGPFFVGGDFKNLRLQCTVFERWGSRGSKTLYCDDKKTIEVSKTVGITKTTSESIQSTLEGEIGVTGVAKVKSSIQALTGYSVQWSVSTTEKDSYEIKAPKCGRKTLSAYALLREYEFVAFKRGNWIFRADFWDQVWDEPFVVVEETGDYMTIPEVSERDQRCIDQLSECREPKESPAFDGRLALNFGPLAVLVPYKVLDKELRLRIDKFGLSYPIADRHRTIMELRSGEKKLNIQRSVMSPVDLFFIGEDGRSHFQVTAKIVEYDVNVGDSRTQSERVEALLTPSREPMEIS